ncbi:unnamed protein product [Mytilus coruscus]|uniref:SHSP domain-containing protein n=1 Tax=Mytilus coruscus TaxID=42192 RepID=A0A6J8BL65_MYTCO|nr:unnamed protein product [Mytilus coruscus]
MSALHYKDQLSKSGHSVYLLAILTQEEIKVKIENDKVFINAKSTEGNEEWSDIVERNRTVKIPKDVDKEKITSFMKSDGSLMLEAPFIESDESKTKILSIEKQTEDEKEVISSESKNDLMNIDIQNYNPEEVSVTCTDGVIITQGKRQRSENGHEIQESFYRKITLPKSVDQKNLKCFKNNDGHLVIKEIIATGDDKNQSRH